MKRLFLMILCGVGLSLNLVVADSINSAYYQLSPNSNSTPLHKVSLKIVFSFLSFCF
ncbi:MAG: hypothetical protein IKR42_06070 [Campylobacter sp.]|nr:hypothetical protein [Campylobacter sp.]